MINYNLVKSEVLDHFRQKKGEVLDYNNLNNVMECVRKIKSRKSKEFERGTLKKMGREERRVCRDNK